MSYDFPWFSYDFPSFFGKKKSEPGLPGHEITNLLVVHHDGVPILRGTTERCEPGGIRNMEV